MATNLDSHMSNDVQVNRPEMNSFLLSKFPVWPDECPELHLSDDEFKSFMQSIPSPGETPKKDIRKRPLSPFSDSQKYPVKKGAISRFIQKLSKSSSAFRTKESLAAENKILTENGDLAFASSEQALVDLFYKFSNSSTPEAMKQLLDDAWNSDAHLTLKLIFQLRSIHVGKGEKVPFYQAMAWLYEWHPKTFLMNLPWIARPIIEKKKAVAAREKEKKKKEDQLGVIPIDDDEDFEMSNAATAYDTFDLDEPHGHAHGYWKDLLNMLVLAVGEKFNFRDATSAFHVRAANSSGREWDRVKAKSLRQAALEQRFMTFKGRMADSRYRAFHAAVARLFASQLAADLALLKGNKANEISIVGKWAPSPKEFHDKHTFIVASIAEIMFPHEIICPEIPKDDRTTYLKKARMVYRFQVLSPLRKALDVVERHITAKTYSDIKYEKVPSIAMSKYNKLFKKNDLVHFNQYLQDVTCGKCMISGAILLPSELVRRAFSLLLGVKGSRYKANNEEAIMLNAQWKTVVERVKRSGRISSSIAICDVSSSMNGPSLQDRTVPMHSSIGLSLLLAEVTELPFGGNMITFSENPNFITAGGLADQRSFIEKVDHIRRAPWGGSTNFVGVFEKLILPMAIEHKLKQEEMVKVVFVFSDMQFNQAENYSGKHCDRWTSSYERIQRQFELAGYEMPKIVFWNLAGRHGGVPVKANEPGTVMISGYSQAQMKIFLDDGGFEDNPVEDNAVNSKEANGMKQAQAMNSLDIVKKAISHRAFAMLKVYD